MTLFIRDFFECVASNYLLYFYYKAVSVLKPTLLTLLLASLLLMACLVRIAM